MWQIIIVVVIVAAAALYVVRSLVRSARGQEHACGGGCPLHENREGTSLPCESVQQAVSAESLEESARNLAGRHAAGRGEDDNMTR